VIRRAVRTGIVGLSSLGAWSPLGRARAVDPAPLGVGPDLLVRGAARTSAITHEVGQSERHPPDCRRAAEGARDCRVASFMGLSVMSSDQHALVYQATKAVSSQRPDGRW
jgi:hypothetical protein